jgi:RNA polymerase-binding transcription factor DksA
MTPDKFKTVLQSELIQITTELESIATLNIQSGDWVAIPVASDLMQSDPNDGADGVEEWNERRAVLAQLEIRHRNIKSALDKIEAGTYGVCEISGEPIEEERLNANPAARTSLANIEREAELPL